MNARSRYEWPCRLVQTSMQLDTVGGSVIHALEVHVTRRSRGLSIRHVFGLASWLRAKAKNGIGEPITEIIP